MRVRIVLGVLLFAVSLVAIASCPAGSHPWVDKWGNQICKTFGSGQTTSIQGTTENCPAGTHPWVDGWGNRICKSLEGDRHYHDTSKGCPAGTHSWVDDWGNRICKRF